MYSPLKAYLPELERHFSLIGQIAFLWNNVEFDLDWLIQSLIVTDDQDPSHDQGYRAVNMVVGRLPNRDKLMILRAVAAAHPLGKELEERIAYVAAAYSILNENRNALIHSRHIYAGKMGSMAWARPSRTSPGKAAHATAPLRVLRGQVTALERLTWHMSQLSMAVRCRRCGWEETVPWPRKFPLPQKLRQPDPATLRTVRPLPPKRRARAKK